MENIYKIYEDVINNKRKRFPMGFWKTNDAKEKGIKLLQYKIKQMKMTNERIQQITQIQLTKEFKLDALYRLYDHKILNILKDAFPEINFIIYNQRSKFKQHQSEIIKNLPKEKWDKIKNGIRNNRYTKEYGKKLSDSQIGELNTCAKLKSTDIPIIRKLWSQGYSAKEIGEKFGVKRQTINDIVFNRTWKHIE